MSSWPPAGYDRERELFSDDAGPCELTDSVTTDSWQGGGVPTKTELVEAGLLKDRQAEAFVLRDVEGRSREEAADLMGLDPSTVDTHLHRARRRVEAARETIALLEGAEA